VKPAEVLPQSCIETDVSHVGNVRE
jgi:hypothetical protein